MRAPTQAIEAFHQAVEIAQEALAEIQSQDPNVRFMEHEVHVLRSFLEGARRLAQRRGEAIEPGSNNHWESI
jgi:hypothetical protein